MVESVVQIEAKLLAVAGDATPAALRERAAIHEERGSHFPVPKGATDAHAIG